MAQRGRKSTANLSVVAGAIEHQTRPEPPPGMPEHQAIIWKGIVSSEPVALFKTAASQIMLQELVRAIAVADVLAQQISMIGPDDLGDPDCLQRLKMLLQMRDGTTKLISMLSTRLRVSNQSKYMPNTIARATRDLAVGPKPWEKGS